MPRLGQAAALEVAVDVLEGVEELVLLALARFDELGGRRALDRAEGLDDEHAVVRDDGAAGLRHDVRMGNALLVTDVGDVPDDIAGVLVDRVVHRAVERGA